MEDKQKLLELLLALEQNFGARVGDVILESDLRQAINNLARHCSGQTFNSAES